MKHRSLLHGLARATSATTPNPSTRSNPVGTWCQPRVQWERGPDSIDYGVREWYTCETKTTRWLSRESSEPLATPFKPRHKNSQNENTPWESFRKFNNNSHLPRAAESILPFLEPHLGGVNAVTSFALNWTWVSSLCISCEWCSIVILLVCLSTQWPKFNLACSSSFFRWCNGVPIHPLQSHLFSTSVGGWFAPIGS